MAVIVVGRDEPAEEAHDRGGGDRAGREGGAEGALLASGELTRGYG